MMNLVDKFTPEAVDATDDDGVVAIEYVLVASAVVAGVTAVFLTGFGATLKTKLTDLLDF